MDEVYSLVIIDSFGIVLKPDGTWYRSDCGRPHFEPRFTDLEAARQYADEIVRRYPYAQCSVFRNNKHLFDHVNAEGLQVRRQPLPVFPSRRRWRVAAVTPGKIALLVLLVLWCCLALRMISLLW